MKYFLLTAVLAVVLPMYGQEKGPTVNPNQANPGNIQQPEAQTPTQSDGARAEPKGYFSRLFSPDNLPSIGLFIAGVVGIWVALMTLKHMRESSERQLQAYVLPENASMIDGTMCVPPQPARANVPFVGMLIKNCGQTPAYKVISWADIAVIAVTDENTKLGIPPIPEKFSNTLGPGSIFNKTLWFDRPLAANEIADIAAGTRAIYLHGKIEYQDAFGKSRFTNFRLRYTGPFPPPANAIFNFSEKGNDAN
jgi:hypothetical protein